MKKLTVLVLLVLCALASMAVAAPVPNWPIERLAGSNESVVVNGKILELPPFSDYSDYSAVDVTIGQLGDVIVKLNRRVDIGEEAWAFFYNNDESGICNPTTYIMGVGFDNSIARVNIPEKIRNVTMTVELATNDSRRLLLAVKNIREQQVPFFSYKKFDKRKLMMLY